MADSLAAPPTPGPTGHPKGSPAERVKMQAGKIMQDLASLYQECHELTGPGSPECAAVNAIMTATAELGAHIGKGMFADQGMGMEAPMEEPMMAPPPEAPPMGGSPFAEAASGFHQDMMGSVPPGASPLP